MEDLEIYTDYTMHIAQCTTVCDGYSSCTSFQWP